VRAGVEEVNHSIRVAWVGELVEDRSPDDLYAGDVSGMVIHVSAWTWRLIGGYDWQSVWVAGTAGVIVGENGAILTRGLL